MKFLTLIAVLLSSAVHASVFNFPTVGDYVLLAAEDGHTKEGVVLSYDKNTKLYEVKYTETLNGKVISVEFQKITPYDVISSNYADTILARCETDMGGTFESIKTPLGNWETCNVLNYESGEEINVGRPPFGIVHGFLWTSTGQQKEFMIQKFKFGP